MSDTRVHFYASDDAQSLSDFELSPAVHPVVLGKSLEKKREDTVVRRLRQLLLKKNGGGEVLAAILGKKEKAEGDSRLVEAFELMSKASFRGRFFGSGPEVVVVDDQEMTLNVPSVDILQFVHFKEESVQGELIKHGIITGEGRNAIHEGRIHISTTLSPTFSEGTEAIKMALRLDEPMRKVVGGIVERTQSALETQVPTDADWSRALLACPEEHFLANLAIFYRGDEQSESPKKGLYRLGDAVLLRYHQINMESYRGSHAGNDHWLNPDKLPLCLVCKKDMPGSQNFARLYGNSLHVSCVPQHVADNHWDDGFELLVRLHNAMFPNSKPVNIPESAQ